MVTEHSAESPHGCTCRRDALDGMPLIDVVCPVHGRGPITEDERARAKTAARSVEFAVEVVARMAIFNALDDIEWGNYPEIGEHDWQQVLDRIDVIGCGLKPMDDDYAEAYAFLESRAEKEA